MLTGRCCLLKWKSTGYGATSQFETTPASYLKLDLQSYLINSPEGGSVTPVDVKQYLILFVEPVSDPFFHPAGGGWTDSGGKTGIACWNSDNKRDYIINVQGITGDGRLISMKKMLRVK